MHSGEASVTTAGRRFGSGVERRPVGQSGAAMWSRAEARSVAWVGRWVGGRGRREENLIGSGARLEAKLVGLNDGLDKGWRGKKVI